MKNAFAYAHLPPHLAPTSRKFAELALWLLETLPPTAERTAALRKILEAKDCAVRAIGDIELPREPADFEGLF